MTQLMGAQHTIEEEEAARATLAESAAELAAAAAEQQRRAAGLEAEVEELRRSLQEVGARMSDPPCSGGTREISAVFNPYPQKLDSRQLGKKGEHNAAWLAGTLSPRDRLQSQSRAVSRLSSLPLDWRAGAE